MAILGMVCRGLLGGLGRGERGAWGFELDPAYSIREMI